MLHPFIYISNVRGEKNVVHVKNYYICIMVFMMTKGSDTGYTMCHKNLYMYQKIYIIDHVNLWNYGPVDTEDNVMEMIL